MSVASAINLEQLQAELQSAQGSFDKWALNTVSAADQLRDSHIRNVSELRGARHVGDASKISLQHAQTLRCSQTR